MKGESAISAWQLAVLLFLSRVTHFFLAEPQREGPQALTAAIWLPLSILASVLLLLPDYFLLQKNKGKGLLDIAGERWGRMGLLFPVVFLLFSICVLVQTACSFSYFLTSAAYPQSSPWTLILLIFVVAGYTASMGYEPTARFGSFVLVALMAAVLFVGVSVWPQAQWEFLRPPSYDGWQNQLRLFIRFTLGNVETVALLFLLPAVNKNGGGVFWKWSLLSFVVLDGIILFATAALGDYAGTQRFPFYAVTKIAELSIFQRLDSLHMAIWVFLALIRLALFLEVGGKSLARLLPQKASKYAVSVCTVVSALLSGFLIGLPNILEKLGNLFAGGIPVLLLTVLLPILLLLSKRKKEAGQ